MVFGLFKRTDPICGMKEEKGKGFRKDGHWFCNVHCMNEYEAQVKKAARKIEKGSCCH